MTVTRRWRLLFFFALMVGLVALAHAADDPFDGARMLADVKTYVDFGVHRTGTPGDVATRKWLVSRFEALGLWSILNPLP